MKVTAPARFMLLALIGCGFAEMATAQDLQGRKPALTNVSYGPDRMNVLDFWPAGGEGPRPLLVYIHGGGWIGGDKKQAEAKFQIGRASGRERV